MPASSLAILVLLRRETVDGKQFLRCVAENVLQVADETVDVPLPGCLVDDVLVVVIAQTSAQLLVVHLWFVLADAPSLGYLVRI